MRALCTAGDAALVGDRDEELEVDKVKAHGRSFLSLEPDLAGKPLRTLR
jgi:hypothetical protein